MLYISQLVRKIYVGFWGNQSIINNTAGVISNYYTI